MVAVPTVSFMLNIACLSPVYKGQQAVSLRGKATGISQFSLPIRSDQQYCTAGDDTSCVRFLRIANHVTSKPFSYWSYRIRL